MLGVWYKSVNFGVQVCCWRPKPQSWMEYLKGYFLGAYPQLRNPDLVQGYLAHKKQPPPQEHHMALGIGLR